MPARHHPLLGAQHDVTVVHAIGREEREKAPAFAFFVRTLRVALNDLGLRKGAGRDRRCVLEHAAHGRAEHGLACRKVGRGLLRRVDPREIGSARG